MHLETLAVHTGREIEPVTGAVTPSITLATTFERPADGSMPADRSIYTRAGNPNRNALERALTMLEGGSEAMAFGSGQAAASAVLQALDPGDHVILPSDLYHGVRFLSRDLYGRWGLQVSFVDLGDIGQLKAAMKPNTRLIWIESPSNPLLKITDIRRVSELAHAAGALCACDNTWATPILQQPLALGCDLVWHSTTKYIGGHSDVLGGAVIVREDSPFAQRIRQNQMLGGGVPSPFDCWLLSRSIPTLPFRVRIAAESAAKVAAYLNAHPKVSRVNYPGLPTHELHDVAMNQMKLPGAMLSFEVAAGREAALAFTAKAKIFTRATSLGGVESLLEHRASIEGPGSTTPQGLVRVSVGLEHVDDLIADLDQALG